MFINPLRNGIFRKNSKISNVYFIIFISSIINILYFFVNFVIWVFGGKFGLFIFIYITRVGLLHVYVSWTASLQAPDGPTPANSIEGCFRNANMFPAPPLAAKAAAVTADMLEACSHSGSMFAFQKHVRIRTYKYKMIYCEYLCEYLCEYQLNTKIKNEHKIINI